MQVHATCHQRTESYCSLLFSQVLRINFPATLRLGSLAKEQD